MSDARTPEPEMYVRLVCAETSEFSQDNSPCYVCGRRLVATPASPQAPAPQAEMRNRAVRFVTGSDGRVIDDDDFTHDASLKISGDFGSDEERHAYAQGLCDRLNAAPNAAPHQGADALREAAEHWMHKAHEFQAEHDDLREDAERLRALLRNNGREFDLSNPATRTGKVLRLSLNCEGCEQYREDGAVDFAATIRAVLDDEIRLAALAQHQAPQQGEQHE